MTHPFHPLAGQDLEFIGRGRAWSGDFVHFFDSRGRRQRIRADFTDVVGPDAFVVAAGGRGVVAEDQDLEPADVRSGRAAEVLVVERCWSSIKVTVFGGTLVGVAMFCARSEAKVQLVAFGLELGDQRIEQQQDVFADYDCKGSVRGVRVDIPNAGDIGGQAVSLKISVRRHCGIKPRCSSP